MHVDIDQRGRKFKEQKADGMSANHQQAAIGFCQSMLQAAILNPAAVQKQKLVLACGSTQRRRANITPHTNFAAGGQVRFR